MIIKQRMKMNRREVRIGVFSALTVKLEEAVQQLNKERISRLRVNEVHKRANEEHKNNHTHTHAKVFFHLNVLEG